MSVETETGIQIVELHMMDKRKYYPLAALSGFCIRGILYPVTLIRTRLQVQKQNTYYKGTFDAFSKILKQEGATGLYRGYLISNLMMVSQLGYITTYEGVRHHLANNNMMDNRKRSFIAGGCASIVGQTFTVPIDIVSQHLQILGNKKKGGSFKIMRIGAPLALPPEAFKTRMGMARHIVRAVYKRDGVAGFYKGYMASLTVYAPSSAMWWFFYDIYCDLLSGVSPEWVPRLALQCVAAPLGGITTTFITNPMDAIRARVQVDNTRFVPTVQALWHEERMRIFLKGLSARLIQSVSFSFFIILGYESLKRLSLLEEYKHQVRW